MYNLLVNALRTLNEFLAAGIAITAFSLLLYALSFNLRDRVARSFALIMVCVVIVYVGDALSSVASTLIVVVFPAPFGPINPNTDPGGMLSESPRTAMVLP